MKKMEKDVYTEWIWTFSWAYLIIKHATLWKDGVCGQGETLFFIGLLWKLEGVLKWKCLCKTSRLEWICLKHCFHSLREDEFSLFKQKFTDLQSIYIFTWAKSTTSAVFSSNITSHKIHINKASRSLFLHSYFSKLIQPLHVFTVHFCP